LTWVYDKFNKANLLKESFTFNIDAKCFESFKTKRILSGPTLRFFKRISKFKIDIQWIDDSKNVLADFLSRVYSATEKVNAKEIGFQKIKQEIQEYHVILRHANVLQLNNFLRFFMKYESKNTLNLTKAVVAEGEICNKYNQRKQFVLLNILVQLLVLKLV
jgi:hypothetical protein